MEKLSKALEGLKNLQFTNSEDQANISKKEKMFFCVLAADGMVSLKAQGVHNLPIVIENMINLCDDKDSDVRMVAEESLNRIIMSLSQSNMLKVQVELHNIIKKNGPARCLRAALTRFGQLSHFIRPNKGRGHVQMLIPALIEIAKREEESIHETLSSSFENIFPVLGVFVQDSALKGLIKSFLHNLSSSNAVIRRCSASCIITIVQYCRKPIVFNCYVLNSLLDCIVPICEDNSPDLVLGVLGCLRLLLPALVCLRSEESISGSFGVRRRQDESLLSVDRLIQAYELCLHYTGSKDHNVVAAALETLNQILQNPPAVLESFFLSPAGFSRSYIQPSKESRFWSRSGSEMSVAMSANDEPLLLDDADVASQFSSLSMGGEFQTKRTSSKPEAAAVYSDDVKTVENPFKEKSLDKLDTGEPSLDVDSDTESAMSDASAPTNFLMRIDTEDKEVDDEEFDRSRSSSQDYLYSPTDSDEEAFEHAIDVGTFTDAAVPLIFCARHVAASFLLDGSPDCLKSDRSIRVSIKSLALSCISAIVKLYPVVMKMTLGKGPSDSRVQGMSDVLLYCDHSDPVIRGNVSVLVGSFINCALSESKNFTSDWLSGDDSKLNCQNLIRILLKGLQDKSSVCARQALSALQLCATRALCSVYNTRFLPLLDYLPALACNSYWLVKVKLVEVLSDLPYVCISDLTESETYQEEVVEHVLLTLLGDEDARVRRATAEALVRIIPLLHNGKWTVLEYGKAWSQDKSKGKRSEKEAADGQPPRFPFRDVSSDPDERIDYSLSAVVAKLSCSLLVPKTKHFLFGYLEALKLLSEKYSTIVYSEGWNFARTHRRELGSNLIAVVLSLILTSPFGLDLGAFSSATVLLGNLFAGLSFSCLKRNDLSGHSFSAENSEKSWEVLRNELVSAMAEEILSHLLKVLNLYSRLLEEATLSSVVDSAGPLLPLLSPLKKQDKKSEDRADEKKTRAHRQSAQYAKLEQLLKNAHTNYQVSLDKAAGEKFLDVLESTLLTLSVVLEVATVKETKRCAEEILSYLLSVVVFRPGPAVICVMQLLKSLFGTNLASNATKDDELSSSACRLPSFRRLSPPRGREKLFGVIFHLPTELLSEKIRLRSSLDYWEASHLVKRPNRKTVVNKSDEHWLATYIRLFEPMVVKSLQLYTVTGDVELQANVLRLLNQLVQLRVNYCMLDGKQIFLDFVLKQFELIENGQIPGVETLLPCIFRFLILLSYEKQHSKPIMSIPKILQLCDGLMASDQPVQTHCIPALSPVVKDIFFSRSPDPSSPEGKELDTQREVLFSMLLRLAEFPEVMDMLASVLSDSRKVGWRKRWERWSRQVVDCLLPLLSLDRLRIDTAEGHNSFAELVSSLSPNVFRPVGPLLKVLFVEPGNYNCPTSLKLWLSKVTLLLEIVLFVGEDALLTGLKEIAPNVNLTSLLPAGSHELVDPLNVKMFFQRCSASERVARFILKVVSVVAAWIRVSCSPPDHLHQMLSKFFVSTFHMLKSEAFLSVPIALESVLVHEQDFSARVCSDFQNLVHVCPILTCQFSYFLALLRRCDRRYWAEIVRRPLTLPAKLVRSCGVVCLCDHLCGDLNDKDTLDFLLRDCLEDLVVLSHEIPVKELFISLQPRPDWALLLKAVSSRSFERSPPHAVEKLLRVLEITDGAHSGALLNLLLEKFVGSPRLALSLLAVSIACRQAEHLLTLPREKAAGQISRQDLGAAFGNRNCLRRYSRLWNLLEKLSVDVFDLPPAAPVEASEVIEGEQLKDGELGEDWYFAQVKRICCRPYVVGLNVPYLLLKLSVERIKEIMSCADFEVKILKDCLVNDNPVGGKTPGKKFEHGLFEVSESLLMRKVSEVREALREVRKEGGGGSEWSGVAERLRSREGFEEQFWEISHCLSLYLEILRRHRMEVKKERVEGIAEWGILCLKMMEEGGIQPKFVEVGLRCCSDVMRSRGVGSSVWVQQRVEECVGCLCRIIGHLIPACRVSKMLGEKDLASSSHSEHLDFLLEFIASPKEDALLPNFLMSPIRDIVVNLCLGSALSPRVLAPPEGSDLQDIAALKSFISRFALIGWRTRQQFEEIWVALLSALGFNTQDDVPPEDTAFVLQATAVAVEGITALLKTTLLDWSRTKLIHHGRDRLALQKVYLEPPAMFEGDDWEGAREHHFLDNLEMPARDERHANGLLSVEYLWGAVKRTRSDIGLYKEHCEELSSIGVDLPSCIYLLIELYNQWVWQESPSIRMVTASLKSSLVISDLFTDLDQFQWLLDFCLRIDKVVIPEDTVILPLLTLGCCKAVAVVLPSEEICEKVKKLMLRSNSSPCRLSAVEGLLYLLQSHVVSRSATLIVDIFLPVALELVREFMLQKHPASLEYDRCLWSLIFYLLQNYDPAKDPAKDLGQELRDLIVTTLGAKTCPAHVMALLVRGVQRLCLVQRLGPTTTREQVEKICLEKIPNHSLDLAGNSLQLLMFLSYLDLRAKGVALVSTGRDDPWRVMREMERLNVLFERLKKSSPREVEVMIYVIWSVMRHLSAADVLTKVIQEYLHPHQPYLKIVSSLLSNVIERVEQSLAEDWIMFSLPSFVQELPVSMSVWTLNCLFLSASSDPWLRKLSPLLTIRVRMADAEDKKLLCLLGARFYRQLKHDAHRKSFAQTFEKAKTIDGVYRDLLSAIS